MRRILLVHPYVTPHGGGQAVAAWAIQALASDYELTVLTYRRIAPSKLDEKFGCSLEGLRFRTVLMPSIVRRAIDSLPTNADLLRMAALARRARQLHARERFDALLSTHNELDLGGDRALVYVHFPWAYWPRPTEDLDWKRRIPVVTNLYRRGSERIGGVSAARLRRQTFLANSRFVAGKIREAHGIEAQVVYPPVPGGFPEVPWDERKPAAVGLGRLSPYKGWHVAVEAVERVRAAGKPLELTLIGSPDSDEYGRLLDRLAAERPWLRILRDLPRGRMVQELARHRYGIHAMQDEHFGIAVAEQLKAGCLPVVHASGGPREIIGGESDLMFDTADEAAARLLRLLDDAALESALREKMRRRAELFSERRFMDEIRAHVRTVIGA